MGQFTNTKKQEIFTGDTVKITAMGRTVTGVCQSVQYHGDQYGIELQSEVHGYVYWKQWTDGGTVTKVG